jgi:hypothetical protein
MSSIDVTAPGRRLHERFLVLGNISGKTVEEIIAVVGPPSSITSMAFGQTLMQWQATGCHMALLFGPDGRFVKITHEYAHFAPAPPPTDSSRQSPQPSRGLVWIVGIFWVLLVMVLVVLGQMAKHGPLNPSLPVNLSQDEQSEKQRENRMQTEQGAREATRKALLEDPHSHSQTTGEIFKPEARKLCTAHSDWDLEVCQVIADREVQIGMTAEQVRLSWGKPERVNKTILKEYEEEQWVYGLSQYLYFRDGLLESMQTSR